MEDAKQRILTAAEELLLKKGVSSTTIAGIARRAEVADSLAYQYFKGKEDLVFSVVLERLKENLEELEDHLQGIFDARSRLSKMIWYVLKYSDRHQGFDLNIVFECRSKKNFYSSEAYKLIRKHAGIMLGILNQGVEEGVFRPDINMRLVRDIIYGTLDFEAINCVITNEIAESSNDLSDIMALILSMISTKEELNNENKEHRILLAAERIFAKHGFSNSKISDIAKLAQVAEGTIYDYFKNKEDLLFSIAGKQFKRHRDSLPELFQIKTPIGKLRRFLQSHFALYMESFDFVTIFIKEIQLNKRFFESNAYKSYQEHYQVLESIIEEGKVKGNFRKEIKPRIVRNAFLGAFTHMALRWTLVEDEIAKHDKLTEINHFIDLFVDAVSKPDSQ